MVKNPPTVQETQVQSLGREDPLEKEMPTHSSILTWEIPWTEEPGGLQSVGSQESDTAEWLTLLGLLRDLPGITYTSRHCCLSVYLKKKRFLHHILIENYGAWPPTLKL